MKTYFVLWIPTLAEIRPPFICKKHVSRKLQDSKFLGGYYLEGDIDDEFNITVSYERTGFVNALRQLCGRKKTVVILHAESHILRKGFIQYSCELPETELDELQKGLAGMMRSPIYHFVKEFYHNHTHHHASQDSLLQAYVSGSFVDLGTHYEEITLYYLNQYRDLLVDFNEETQTQISILKKRINRVHKVKQSITTLGDIVKSGNELCGQLNYMDFLMNKVAHQYSVPKNLRSEIQVLRKNAQLILNDASTAYNVSTAALGVNYGIQGIRWGIGGVFTSCALFAVSTYIASVDHATEKYINEIFQKIVYMDSTNIVRETDSIHKEIQAVEQRLDNLEKTVKPRKSQRALKNN